MDMRSPRPDDEAAIASFFAALVEAGDDLVFHPHAFTPREAGHLAAGRDPLGRPTRDLYRFGFMDGIAVAYGLLRGWDEGFNVPSLGVAVHPSRRGRGLARRMMHHLHAAARDRGAAAVRLKVYAHNAAALALYRELGYSFSDLDAHELLGRLSLAGPAPRAGRSHAPSQATA